MNTRSAAAEILSIEHFQFTFPDGKVTTLGPQDPKRKWIEISNRWADAWRLHMLIWNQHMEAN